MDNKVTTTKTKLIDFDECPQFSEKIDFEFTVEREDLSYQLPLNKDMETTLNRITESENKLQTSKNKNKVQATQIRNLVSYINSLEKELKEKEGKK